MTDYIAAITPQTIDVRDAYVTLREHHDDLSIAGLALVSRRADGTVEIVEKDDLEIDGKVAGGALIGLLVGVLAGPLGALLGAGVGAVTPGVVSAADAGRTDDALVSFSRLLAPGSSVVLAYTKEDETGPLDQFAARLNGTVERQKVSEVLAELEAKEKAQRAAEDAARKALRESRAKEWDADLAARWEHLKAVFGSSPSQGTDEQTKG